LELTRLLELVNDGDVAHRGVHGRFTRESQPFCTTDELAEFWDFEDRLVEELYCELLETWRIQSGDEVLEVLTETLEPKFGERRKDAVLWRRGWERAA